MKTQIFVMPAWIAGIQVRLDASGDIHVNLDSSTPCWNDAVELFAQTDRGLSGPIFSKETLRAQRKEFLIRKSSELCTTIAANLRVLRKPFVTSDARIFSRQDAKAQSFGTFFFLCVFAPLREILPISVAA
jgi:hypothetical protein